jgi:Rieske Fe-S protein
MRRREVVKLGMLAIGCAGCGGGGDEMPVDAAGTTSGFEICGANICFHLTDPTNAALLDVNGARPANVPDKIVIVRLSATEFSVVSRICTHNGCNVSYQPSAMELVCGCHGSRFTATGVVTREPATRNLRSYAHAFDEATQVLTIMLA